MKSEHEINNLIKKSLHNSTSSISFEELWDMHSSKGRNRSKYRKAALIPLIVVFTLFACFSIGYGYSRLVDNTNLLFIDDPEIIGTWETVDFVENIKDFTPEKHFFYAELFHLNKLVFNKNGKMLVRIENSNIDYSAWTWTKGVIIDEVDKTASKYEIKEIDGSKYMFMEWKSGDYIYRFKKPEYYVLKKME